MVVGMQAPRVGAPSDSSKGQITWSWHFTNYGQTPALHVSFSDFLIVNGKQDAAFQPRRVPPVAAPLPTGNEDFASIISQNLTTREQFSSLMNTDGAITIEGEITYSDAAGNPYSTIFCLTHLATGAILYCQGKNDIR